MIVLDGESHESRKLGTLVTNLNLPGRVEVKYEMPPPQGTLCSGWRSEGYARQQYSSFYADQYTDAEYVAFVDTDAGFVTPGERPMSEASWLTPRVAFSGRTRHMRNV